MKYLLIISFIYIITLIFYFKENNSSDSMELEETRCKNNNLILLGSVLKKLGFIYLIFGICLMYIGFHYTIIQKHHVQAQMPNDCSNCDNFIKNINQLKTFKDIKILKGYKNACNTCSSMCNDSLALKKEFGEKISLKDVTECSKYKKYSNYADKSHDILFNKELRKTANIWHEATKIPDNKIYWNPFP